MSAEFEGECLNCKGRLVEVDAGPVEARCVACGHDHYNVGDWR